MRWSYIIPRLIIVALVWAFVTWGKDPLLHYSMVRSLQAVTGAKADIAQVQTQLFPPRMTVDRVALASASAPGTNIIQFDQLEFRLAGDPLLRRQFVVEEGRLTGVRFHTTRQDDGQLEVIPEDDAEGSEPSWMQEKLKQAGEEWLANLLDQTKAQLDPDRLETYRTGREVYAKWDVRFQDLTDRARLLKPRFEQLRSQFEDARRGDPLQMIERYLQIAQRAEQLTRDAQQIRDELTGISPEVKSDFARLDQARKNDQEMVKHSIALLKPDARRVTESLIGEQMYLQLQQLLSWIQLAQQYQTELAEQAHPPRPAGRDFEFPLLNPTPDFHLQKMLISGEVEIDGRLVPFEAELSDVTEDAPLLGRPCVFRLHTTSQSPLEIHVTYDARTQLPVTQIIASYKDPNGRILASGKPDKAALSARLSDVSWGVNLTVVDQQIGGAVQLQSQLSDAVFTARDSIRPELLSAARDAIGAIQQVGATLSLGGTLLKPSMQLESDLGQQIVDGVQLAFTQQLTQARDRLLNDVNTYASDQVSKLTTKFGSEYQKLKSENADLIAQVEEVRTIAVALRSGKLDANTVLRTVSDSKFVNDKQKRQVDQAMQDVNAVMNGGLPASVARRIPGGSIDNAVPGLMEKALPGNAARLLNGQLPGVMDSSGMQPGLQQALPGLRLPNSGTPTSGMGVNTLNSGFRLPGMNGAGLPPQNIATPPTSQLPEQGATNGNPDAVQQSIPGFKGFGSLLPRTLKQ